MGSCPWQGTELGFEPNLPLRYVLPTRGDPVTAGEMLVVGAASAGTLRGQAALRMSKDTAGALRALATQCRPSLCRGSQE